MEKLHRLPSEVPFVSVDEMYMLIAYTQDEGKRMDVCGPCISKDEVETKTCYRCGLKYTRKHGVIHSDKMTPEDKGKALKSMFQTALGGGKDAS